VNAEPIPVPQTVKTTLARFSEQLEALKRQYTFYISGVRQALRVPDDWGLDPDGGSFVSPEGTPDGDTRQP